MIFCEHRPWKNSSDTSVHFVFRGRDSAHLMADTHDELMEYAEEIGLRLHWIQKAHQWDEHFDVVGVFLVKVQKDPRVMKLTRENFVEKLRLRRAAAVEKRKTND